MGKLWSVKSDLGETLTHASEHFGDRKLAGQMERQKPDGRNC